MISIVTSQQDLVLSFCNLPDYFFILHSLIVIIDVAENALQANEMQKEVLKVTSAFLLSRLQ